jgi:hypothetical protein
MSDETPFGWTGIQRVHSGKGQRCDWQGLSLQYRKKASGEWHGFIGVELVVKTVTRDMCMQLLEREARRRKGDGG